MKSAPSARLRLPAGDCRVAWRRPHRQPQEGNATDEAKWPDSAAAPTFHCNDRQRSRRADLSEPRQEYCADKLEPAMGRRHHYIVIATGFVYLAAILDAWSRRVVGYAIGKRFDARLALAALRAAIAVRRPPAGCIHHSDRGSQYAAEDYRAELAKHGLKGSMGRRGHPYHHAKGARRPTCATSSFPCCCRESRSTPARPTIIRSSSCS